MKAAEVKNRVIPGELKFSTSRSRGPGGQNVNKVNTKVELRFNIHDSDSFTDSEKELIKDSLKNRISKEGDLLIFSQSERTQLQNRKKAEEKLFRLLAKALTVKPLRKTTRPTTASRERRLDEKKKHSKIKYLRKASGRSSDE